MSGRENIELEFIQALQAVFGPKCSRFNSDLRARLRQLYDFAHADGVLAALNGARPLVPIGETVDHFSHLGEGDLIQNAHLRDAGRARKILQTGEITIHGHLSVLVDTATGQEIDTPSVYTPNEFTQYSPYTAVTFPDQNKKSA